ncbi:hypothetical protein [Collinsella bouchesdurhonensis]|uniref:hypothetical protein n=1 Tax=Collinsella bouchesdurhonensis TaxID=1907654 RepID=UPI00356A2AE8
MSKLAVAESRAFGVSLLATAPAQAISLRKRRLKNDHKAPVSTNFLISVAVLHYAE